MDDDDRDDHQSYHYETSDYDDETLKKGVLNCCQPSIHIYGQLFKEFPKFTFEI